MKEPFGAGRCHQVMPPNVNYRPHRTRFVYSVLSTTVVVGCLAACATPKAEVAVVELVPPVTAPMGSAEPESTDEAAPPPDKKEKDRPPEAHVEAPDPARNEARRLFQLGAEAYDRGDYAGAQKHFQAAYQLVPERALLFNIASCELRLGNTREACQLFRKYVATGDPSDPRVADVQTQLSNRCRGVP